MSTAKSIICFFSEHNLPKPRAEGSPENSTAGGQPQSPQNGLSEKPKRSWGQCKFPTKMAKPGDAEVGRKTHVKLP